MKHDKEKKPRDKSLTTFPEETAPEITSLNTITSPLTHADDKLSREKINMESAGQIGRTSDAVLTGSPAAEYGSTGRFALDGMIKASERIAKEKYRSNRSPEGKD